jgi:AcrR family transcriptional regulator
MATAYSPPFTLTPVETDAEPAADRTEALVRAAYDLLEEAGLEGLTIRAVLARAGLARRAFYERFQGKDDLVLAVFAGSLRAAAQRFRSAGARCAGPVEALEAIVTGIVRDQLGEEGASRRGAALAREHLRLAQTRPAELALALEPLLDVIAGHIAEGIGRGLFRPAEAQGQARLVYNLVSTTVHTALLAQDGEARANSVTLAEDLWSFCRRAIVA